MSRTTSSGCLFPQEAIRVQAQVAGENGSNQIRRFSIDPALTDFNILKHIIGKAFDLKGDFVINYRVLDDDGGEAYLPLVSDWDLEATFISASTPDLQLMIEPRNIPIDGEEDTEPSWEIVKSNEVIKPNPIPIANHHRTTQGQGSKSKNQNPPGNNKFQMNPVNFNAKINTTGIFNTMERWVQKAMTFVEDISVVTTRPPLSDVEFRNYLDHSGTLTFPKELRYACFHGGVEPSLRRVVWKHLLNVYPDGLSGNERITYIRNKAKEYVELRNSWKITIHNGIVNEEVHCVSNMVRKDVLRTDRHLKFFAGNDDNPNITSLFNILTTYALHHPSVSYCQGMSDLASPLLMTMGDEGHAYICFCALMDRLNPNFNSDGLAMSLKFTHLSEALAHCDGYFWSYLKSMGADDLLFCYRWLLLELKREFVFEDALRMLEVLWSSLPYKPQDVRLYEVKYSGLISQSIPIPVPSLTSSYSKVCAIRRSSTTITASDLRNRRYSRNNQKTNPYLSLDENSLSSLSSTTSSGMMDSHRKPYYSLDDTMEVLSCNDFPQSTSPFEILTLGNLANISLNSPKPKLIKNLKEFWTIGRTSSKSSKKSPSPGSNPDSANSDSNTTGLNIEEHKSNSAPVFVEKDLPHSSKFVFPESENTSEVFVENGFLEKGDSKCGKSTTGFFKPTSPNHSKDDNVKKSVHVNGTLTTVVSQNPKTHHDGEFSDSENDSGHCCDSVEIENSLEEPEFQTGGNESTNSIMKLPCPEEFGGGNPFLMFLCLTMLLQHRDHIMRNQMDYNETAMYFDKMVRKHNVVRVLAHARQMYANYLKQRLVPRV